MNEYTHGEKTKFFLGVEGHLLSLKGVMELENCHLSIIIVTINSGREHRLMLKPEGESWMRTGYLHSLKVSSHKTVISFIGGKK